MMKFPKKVHPKKIELFKFGVPWPKSKGPKRIHSRAWNYLNKIKNQINQ